MELSGTVNPDWFVRVAVAIIPVIQLVVGKLFSLAIDAVRKDVELKLANFKNEILQEVRQYGDLDRRLSRIENQLDGATAHKLQIP